MATLDEGPILELGRNPLPGDAPCGSDPGDDMTYIEVDAEMNKLGRIEAGEPDWYQIEQGCKTILSSVAKDVEVASWYGHALFKQYGYAGLAAALGLLTELVNNFWDGVYPSRPRRRKARIETLADQFTEGEWFRENQPSGDADFDALDLCLTRSEELNAALTEKMPDDPPDFKKFTRGLKSHAEKRPKPLEPAPAAAPSAAEAAKASVAPATAGGFAAGDVQDASGAINALLNACTFLRNADPTDPIPYAVIRVVKWSKISMPVTEEAKFQIPPPEKTTVEALAHQMANSLWEHLLKGAEAAFRSNDPLWLDLQRYTCAALAGYGPSYEKAKQAVMAATAGLVNRLGDGLFELKFSSGMPLCSGETRMWVETEVLASQGGDERGGGGAADGRLAEAMASAKKLAGSGKLKEGLKELQEGLTQCMQRRDRFLWRLSIARLCFDAQRHQLAAPLLEECYEDVQRFNIDDWEPSLAASVADTLYRCRKSLASAQKEPPPEDLKSVRESFAWLCRLDPLAALAAEPSGK